MNTFRFNLSTWEKGGRIFRDTTFRTNANDIETIIQYFKKKFRDIYLVGHSFGAIAVILANHASVKGLVLWNPSYGFNKTFADAQYKKAVNGYLLKEGFEIIISKETFEEIERFPDCLDLVKRIRIPIKFIAAGKGPLVKACKLYFRHANTPKDLAIVKGATHCFDEEGKEEQLFEETLNWVERY